MNAQPPTEYIHREISCEISTYGHPAMEIKSKSDMETGCLVKVCHEARAAFLLVANEIIPPPDMAEEVFISLRYVHTDEDCDQVELSCGSCEIINRTTKGETWAEAIDTLIASYRPKITEMLYQQGLLIKDDEKGYFLDIGLPL